MEQSLTIRSDEYNLIRIGALRWAAILNLLQDTLGQPCKFYAHDFLISFEFDHEILAVFCSQGRRRGEVVISTDSRNPHVHLVATIEQGIQRLRSELAEAETARRQGFFGEFPSHDELDDEEDDE